ncbi:hypothetical protein Nepgr_033640 [Nepenthes gracilis]|uniref:Uncharacterized protein n=1 Tax=Nepenthes gracilis TaxID=150966 RepID=A0AAD3TM98_NEPGR|nr:hypothetical protein Nepgr_033640 [Nepenthes gracilis]
MAGFSKSSSSPGIEPTIRATSNQPEPDSNGYTNLHISRQIPLRSPTLGASPSSGSIQHSSQKTNTARSAPPIYLQLAARAAFQASSIVDPSNLLFKSRKSEKDAAAAPLRSEPMYHRRQRIATIHTAPGHTIVAASADTDQPRYHNAQISMVDNHIAA